VNATKSSVRNAMTMRFAASLRMSEFIERHPFT
jgi:hypothetical protein